MSEELRKAMEQHRVKLKHRGVDREIEEGMDEWFGSGDGSGDDALSQPTTTSLKTTRRSGTG